MYKIKVNNHIEYQIEQTGAEFSVNGKVLSLDTSSDGKHTTNVIFNNKCFNTEVVAFDKKEKSCVVKVNGNIYTIQVEDQFDQLLKQLGMDNLIVAKIAEIKAPMPGLVLSISVKEGDEIQKGDNLLILEAMKMENILKSSTDGLVKKILVKQGDKVEKNQILIQF